MPHDDASKAVWDLDVAKLLAVAAALGCQAPWRDSTVLDFPGRHPW